MDPRAGLRFESCGFSETARSLLVSRSYQSNFFNINRKQF